MAPYRVYNVIAIRPDPMMKVPGSIFIRPSMLVRLWNGIVCNEEVELVVRLCSRGTRSDTE